MPACLRSHDGDNVLFGVNPNFREFQVIGKDFAFEDELDREDRVQFVFPLDAFLDFGDRLIRIDLDQFNRLVGWDTRESESVLHHNFSPLSMSIFVLEMSMKNVRDRNDLAKVSTYC